MRGYARLPERIAQAADLVLSRTAALLFAVVLLLSVYTLYDSLYLYRQSSPGRFDPASPAGGTIPDFPDNAVARLTLDDTPIDYPVMQGTDNREYLNRDPSGQYSLAGSLFLDCRNSADFSDDYSMIYGHHMSARRMFGALDDYRDADYCKTHRTGTLTTPEYTYDLTVFAVMNADAGDRMIFDMGTDVPERIQHSEHSSAADMRSRLRWIEQQALIWDQPAAGRVLALSTCSSSGTTKRLIVFAVMSAGKANDQPTQSLRKE